MLHPTQAEKVIDYILKNTSKLSPEKIEALAKVVESAKGVNEISLEPNSLPPDEVEDSELLENHPINFSEVQGIEVDGRKIKTEIYKS